MVVKRSLAQSCFQFIVIKSCANCELSEIKMHLQVRQKKGHVCLCVWVCVVN